MVRLVFVIVLVKIALKRTVTDRQATDVSIKPQVFVGDAAQIVKRQLSTTFSCR